MQCLLPSGDLTNIMLYNKLRLEMDKGMDVFENWEQCCTIAIIDSARNSFRKSNR